MKGIIWGVLILGINCVECSRITGFEIAQKVDERYKGKSAKITGEMILFDETTSKQRKREFIFLRREIDKKDRILFEFTYPKDIKGTKFLVIEREEENERFLYLPALGRTKRIASSEKEENFLDSDFSYEDIAQRRLHDYTYELLKESTTCFNKPCWLLASYPKEKIKFSKIVSFVDKESLCILKALYYDKNGKLIKIYKVEELIKIEDIWTVTKSVVENLENKHKTIMILKKVEYNIKIPSWKFTKEALTE